MKGTERERDVYSIDISPWYENATDEDLVVAALMADFAAFEMLIARHRSAVTKVAQSIVGIRAMAEDIAQDTFVAAFQSLPSLNDPARFGPWVCRIARFRALRVRDREHKIQAVDSEPLEAMVNDRHDWTMSHGATTRRSPLCVRRSNLR